MTALTLLIIFLFNLFCIESRTRGSEWIQDAYDTHSKRADMRAKDRKETDMRGKERKETDMIGLQKAEVQDLEEDLEMDSERAPDIDDYYDDLPYKPLDPHDIINKNDYDLNQFANPLEMRDFETQHSFQHPIDMLSQNWILIGDAVATTNFARLTPEDVARRGVIWNKFALHQTDFQILMEINIHNSNRNEIGGDGFGVWFLDENDLKRAPDGDRTSYNEESYELLLGDFYGIRRDFNGTGIVFDTYDNDNNGDNPLIFSIKNDGKPNSWNFKTDLSTERDEVKKEIEQLAMFHPGAKEMFPTECTLDYHGKESVKILIRYQKGRIHVYTDLKHKKVEGSEPSKIDMFKKHAMPFAFGPHMGMTRMFDKLGMMPAVDAEIPHLCLVRKIDFGEWKNPHIVLSGITGQVSDIHDILKLETKFLRKEHEIDDEQLPSTGYKKRSGGVLMMIYWFVICLLSVGLICETIGEIAMIRQIYKSNRHIVKTINRLNPFIQLSYYLNLIQYILLVFSFHWKCLFCNAPLLLIRAQKFMTNNVLLTPQNFEQPIFIYNTRYRQWLWVQLILLCMSGFYHFWRLFHI